MLFLIINMGRKAWIEQESRLKIYMGTTLSGLPIWKDFERWHKLFQYTCENLMKQEDLNRKISQGTGEFIINNIKGIGSSFGGLFSTKHSKSPKKIINSQFYLEGLTEIGWHLSVLDIDYVLAVEILKDIIHLNKIEAKKTKKIFEAQLQRKYAKSQKGKSIRANSNKKSNKYGRLFPFRRMVEYLSPANGEFLQVLLVCKDWHKAFRRPLLRIFLIEQENLKRKERLLAWESILGRDPIPDYKAEVSKHFNLKELEQTITMDVHRSYTDDKTFPREKLTRILRVTARLREKEYSYHQGMNYICGLFLKMFKEDEERTFGLFLRIMDKYIWNTYMNEFAQMYLGFYQLTRLLQIFLPVLSDHFMVAHALPFILSLELVFTMIEREN